jgi:putative peptidoglycan lipid II flippase
VVLATVSVNLITCLGLTWALAGRLGGLPLRVWSRDSLLLLLAAMAAGCVAWGLSTWVAWPAGFLGLLLQNGLCAGLALATYGLIGALAGVPEVRQLLAMAGRRRPA